MHIATAVAGICRAFATKAEGAVFVAAADQSELGKELVAALDADDDVRVAVVVAVLEQGAEAEAAARKLDILLSLQVSYVHVHGLDGGPAAKFTADDSGRALFVARHRAFGAWVGGVDPEGNETKDQEWEGAVEIRHLSIVPQGQCPRGGTFRVNHRQSFVAAGRQRGKPPGEGADTGPRPC